MTWNDSWYANWNADWYGLLDQAGQLRVVSFDDPALGAIGGELLTSRQASTLEVEAFNVAESIAFLVAVAGSDLDAPETDSEVITPYAGSTFTTEHEHESNLEVEQTA